MKEMQLCRTCRSQINRSLKDEEKISFHAEVRQLFSAILDTGTDHICISIREYRTHNLSIGRVEDPEKGVAVVDADIRQGRTVEQHRKLGLGFIELMHKHWGVQKEQIHVTLTAHKGEDFHLPEKYLRCPRRAIAITTSKSLLTKVPYLKR